MEFGQRKKYSDNQTKHLASDAMTLDKFDNWTNRFAGFVHQKGKVEPGEYRAFGLKPPGHRWAEKRTIRDFTKALVALDDLAIADCTRKEGNVE